MSHFLDKKFTCVPIGSFARIVAYILACITLIQKRAHNQQSRAFVTILQILIRIFSRRDGEINSSTDTDLEGTTL